MHDNNDFIAYSGVADWIFTTKIKYISNKYRLFLLPGNLCKTIITIEKSVTTCNRH